MPIKYPPVPDALSPAEYADYYSSVAAKGQAGQRSFLLFSSSETDGQLWCPYCRDIQPALEDVFGQPDGPEVFVQLTGQRDVWKSPENPLRVAPYGVKRVPTLIAFEAGKEVARLSGGALQAAGGLRDFVKA